MFSSEVLVEVMRGEIVESFHIGDIAVTDTTGSVLYYAGDPHKVTYMRSSAKPLQAIRYVELGGPEKYGLTDEEVAVTCASHSGEDYHVNAVLSVLGKIGLDESYLQCGTHMPIHRATAAKMMSEGKKSTWVHSNCSGKHAGMLVLNQLLGADPKKYLDLEGAVQSVILEVSSDMMGLKPSEVKIGIDGCGAPVFGVPLSAMARGWALLSEPSGLPSKRAAAIAKITSCMRAHPRMVAGTERFNTKLLEVAGDRVVAKSGAEGVFCMGIMGKGIGIALKVADGNGARGLEPATIEVLRQLGVLESTDITAMKSYYQPEVKNFRGDLCGYARAAVELKKA